MTATVLEMTESSPLAGGARSEDGRAAPGAGVTKSLPLVAARGPKTGAPRRARAWM
jgi:hypothetical protein